MADDLSGGISLRREADHVDVAQYLADRAAVADEIAAERR
jgi:hypothetical protein